MKLRQFECLRELVDCGFNISKAAQALSATPPAIGKQIRLLENELNLKLLNKQGNRITGLTPGGAKVFKSALGALREVSNIRRICNDLSDPLSGSIAIATSHTNARYTLLPAIKEFIGKYPSADLRLQQGEPEQIVHMVLEGTSDLGIMTKLDQFPNGLVCIECRQMKHSLVVPIGHPLTKKRVLSLSLLAQFPIIAHDVAHQIGAEISRSFQEAGLHPKFVFQTFDSDVMKAYVEAGVGIAIIPKIAFSPSRDKKLRSMDVSHLFQPTTMFAIFRRDVYLNNLLLNFVQLIAPHVTREMVEELVQRKD